MSVKQPPHPTTDDRESTKKRWASVQSPAWFKTWGAWRTEPEIDTERQRFLDNRRRTVQPNLEQGSYPFKDIEPKLTRADIEWLLVTHESNGIVGPVDLNNEQEHGREGLDLRGADLQGLDLSGLPLTCMRGGVTRSEWRTVTSKQREAAAVHCEDATMTATFLEGAHLRSAHLERAYLHKAHLEGSELVQAYLKGAILFESSLGGKTFGAEPKGLWFRRRKAKRLTLRPADLHLAFFDDAASLYNSSLGDREFGGIRLADVRWNDANLTRTSWRQIAILGDETEALYPLASNGQPKDPARRLEDYQTAVRAYRQMAITLRGQGVNEDADRYAYRASVVQRQVLLRQGQWLRYLGSSLLDLIAGYGYKPLRSLGAYLFIILGFTALYLLNSQFVMPHLSWDEALVLSISSFHGRGFFPSNVTLGDTLARLAAAEAVIGLVIEVTFIATFTQRFFAR